MARRWVMISLIGLSLTIMVAWFTLGHSLSASADGGQTTRVSVSSTGLQGNLASGSPGGSWSHPDLSASGRFVAFHSEATNLVSDDTNNASDVFVHDRQTGQTTRVSVSSVGVQGNSDSEFPGISADGRYVTFSSTADNLVSDDTNGSWDVFVHDRQTGQTERVSVSSAATEGNDDSIFPVISGDGRIVAFQSDADNLDPSFATGGIYVHDRQTGQTRQVADQEVQTPAISADGRFVAFSTLASNLVPGDYFGYWDVFVHDRQTGATELVSVSSQGGWGNGDSTHPALSDDGRYVVFYSNAFTLASSGRNILVHDRQTGQTSGVDVSSLGTNANQLSLYPDISGDGRYVIFQSEASNLVDNDTATCLNAINFPMSCQDIFLHDRQTGQTERVSIDSAGVQGNGDSVTPAVSADGRTIVFVSKASNLVSGDTNEIWDVFVHERETSGSATATATGSPTASVTPTKTATPTLTQTSTNTPAPTSTATATATGLPTSTATATATGLPTATATATATGLPTATATNPPPATATATPTVTTTSTLPATATPTKTPQPTRTPSPTPTSSPPLPPNSGSTTLVSIDSFRVPGNDQSLDAVVSSNGRIIAFSSDASNLVVADTNGARDIFVHDRETGITSRVSTSSAGAQANGMSFHPGISGDGRYVVFRSYASNIVSGDTNERSDIFLHDRQTQISTRISINSNSLQGNGDSFDPAISANGRYIVYSSRASNLVPSDEMICSSDYSWWNCQDVFIYDRFTGETELVSIDSNARQANQRSFAPAVSADGRWVAFSSEASNLVSDDNNRKEDIFIHDRESGATSRVSVSTNGEESNGVSGSPTISADGQVIAFASSSTNLVPDDTNTCRYTAYLRPCSDVFVHQLQTGVTTRVSVSSNGGQANEHSGSPMLSADGRYVVFQSSASNLVADDTARCPAGLVYENCTDVFVHDRVTGSTSRVSVDSAGVEAKGHSGLPAISADSRSIVFQSYAANLVPGDTNREMDVFVRDRLAGTGGEHAIAGHVWDDRYDIPGSYVPLPGVTLELDTGATTVSAADGSYAFTGLAAGSYRVSARKTGYHLSPGGFWTVDVPPSRDDIDFIGWSVPVVDPIANADGDGNYTVSWTGSYGATSYQLLASRNGASYRTIYAGSKTAFDVRDSQTGEWCYRVQALKNSVVDSMSDLECTEVKRPVGMIDLTISIYRLVPEDEREAYKEILEFFADAVYEMSNGAHRVRNVTFYQRFENERDADVRWVVRTGPNAIPNGIGVPYAVVNFADIQKADIDVNLLFLRRYGGYVLAHEWGHYYYGLYDEYEGSDAQECRSPTPYCAWPGDIPVKNSVMNSVVDAAMGPPFDINYLNFSIGKNFKPTQEDPQSAQYRVHGASGWDTLVRPVDPPESRIEAFPTRNHYPELAAFAPIGNADASLELNWLGGGPGQEQARGVLNFTWREPTISRDTAQADLEYWAEVMSFGGARINYPEPVVLTAAAKQHDLIAGARLKATAIAPDGAEVQLSLLDDGRSPDAIANDGIYTGFLPYDQNGDYWITVDFDNVPGTAYFTQAAYLPPLPFEGNFYDPLSQPQPPVSAFTASVSTSVVIEGYQTDDHGDFPELATFLTTDNTRYAGRIDRAGDVDVFQLDLPATGGLMLRVTELALDMHPRIRVFEDDGFTVLGEYEMAPDAEEYFLLELTGDPGEPIYVEIQDEDSSASGGLYKLSAGEALPNEIDDPGDLNGLIYLPMIVD